MMPKKEDGSDGIPHALFPSLGCQLKIITLFNCMYKVLSEQTSHPSYFLN
jgi:hypothetical protein